MKIYKIGNKNYYMLSNIKSEHIELFKGCMKINNFMNKHNVPEDKYIYGISRKRKWVSCEETTLYCKIFILQSWFCNTYPDIATNDNDDGNDSNDSDNDDSNDSDNDDSNESDNDSNDKIEKAPEIIKLNKREKFTNNDGVAIDIEIRGEKDHKKCYFRVSDVSTGFNIRQLYDVITNKKGSYKINIDYKYFCYGKSTAKKLFLTYTGLLRALFTSRSGTANTFIDWAAKTLFTSQMGTREQRNKLASEILGISVDNIKSVFGSTSISCLYLFSLGTVKNLRKSLKLDDDYDDNDTIYKWGLSKSLVRRSKEHNKTFSKVKGCDLKLIWFELVDPNFLFQAETDIKEILIEMEWIFEHDISTELAIIPSNKLKFIKKQFHIIANAYIGNCKNLSAEIDIIKSDYEKKLFKFEYEKELLQKDNKILQTEKDNIMLQKNVEILQLKNELLNKNLNTSDKKHKKKK